MNSFESFMIPMRVRSQKQPLTTRYFWQIYFLIPSSKTSLTVCYYHVMYTFQSESTLCSCLNVKKIHARNRTSEDTVKCTVHPTDKYSQHSPTIWPVWLNGWVFLYELIGCGFESRCSHLRHPWFTQFFLECLYISKRL